jgi:hypothetical protein
VVACPVAPDRRLITKPDASVARDDVVHARGVAMRVAVTVQHPAHVHFFRPVVTDLTAAGHEVAVFVREKDVAERLLSAYGLPYTLVAGASAGVVTTQLRYEYRLFRRLRRWDPDVVAAIGGLAASHVATALGVPSVVFTDTELRSNWLMAPFADVVCTPRQFRTSFGTKHRRYDGFHELAYLHPDRFDPDSSVLEAAGVDPDRPYSVVRFSDMGAHHDVGERGFSARGKRALCSALEENGAVYVAAEGTSEGRSLPVAPHEFHHLLAYADLVVSDSSTTATEAALLGTPAVRSNSFAGAGDVSNFTELGERYGLVYSTPDESAAVERCTALLEDPTAGERWRERRDRLLRETVDVAAFATGVVETVGRAADASDSPTAVVARG